MNENFSVLRDPSGRMRLCRVGEDKLRDEAGAEYPIVNGIPRFVSPDNYAGDFGAQWNRFPKTQLDSHAGVDISEVRLDRCVKGLANLKGKLVLEAGSGAGRFTEILLKHGATLHSFDFSNAVEANAANNGAGSNLTLVQADIRQIPFERRVYDYVICLGVLQHTPDPEQSISCLWEMVKPGGHLVIDHYRWNIGLVLPPPLGGAESLYRTIILRLPKRWRFKTVERITKFWFPIHWAFKGSRTAQRILRRLSPVHFYYSDHKLRDKQMYFDWALLDTHDGTTDVYKHYRNEKQIELTLRQLGAEEIEIRVDGNGVEAICRKSGPSDIAGV